MFRSLRSRLTIGLVLLAVLPLVVVVTLIAFRAYATLQVQAIDYQVEIAKRTATEIQAFIGLHENELRLLTAVRGVQNLPEEDQWALLEGLLATQPTFRELALLDNSGQELLIVSDINVHFDWRNRSEEPEFLYPIQNHEIYYSSIWFTEEIREPMFTLALPIENLRSGEITHVLVADLQFKTVWELLKAMQYEGSTDVFVIDKQNQIVAHQNPSVVLSGTTYDPPTVSSVGVDLGGTTAIVARQSVSFGNHEFTVIATRPYNEAIALANNLLQLTVIVTLTMVVIAIGLAFVTIRYVVNPIEELAVVSRAIRGGDFSQKVDMHRADEIGDLAHAFTDMTNNLQQMIDDERTSKERLKISEQQFRLLAENSTDMISRHDPDGVYLYASPACKTLLGYEPEELIGHSAYEFFHPADTATIQQFHTTIIEQSVTHTIQYRIRRKDDAYLWFETTSRLITDKQTGALVEIQASTRDIAKRKQVEESLQRYIQRLTMLHEIDQHIVVAHSPHEIANIIVERLIQLISCEWLGVILYDEETEEAQIIALQRINDSDTQIEKSILLASNPILEQLKAGQPIVTTDLKATGETQNSLDLHVMNHDLRSGMAIPLMVHNRLIGILTLASLQVGFFTSEHQTIAEEVGTQVAIAFHQAELYDKIERHNAELEQRVSERTLQLEEANKELRVLSHVKDEFVSNVSHELRTPITSLKLRQYLLRTRPGNWEEHLDVVAREIKRLEHIIESLLYLSRLDQERIELNPTHVDLNPLVSQFVSDRVALAQSHKLELSFTGEADLPFVKVDVALWEQALSVLLTNAFNYTPAGGRVAVKTMVSDREGRRWVGVCVSDTGPGISPEEQQHLFERFFRGTAGRESGAPGTGLGLSIVDEIVKKHQGWIEVLSEGIPGKGTTFNLWLSVVKLPE